MTDHYPRSKAWITKLQGPGHSRGEKHLDYRIDNDNGGWVNMEVGWRSGLSRSSIMRSFGSDGDTTDDARSQTQPIDHDISCAWLCGHIIACTHHWREHIVGVDHIPRSTTERSTTPRSTTPRSTMPRSTTERSTTECLLWTTLCKK